MQNSSPSEIVSLEGSLLRLLFPAETGLADASTQTDDEDTDRIIAAAATALQEYWTLLQEERENLFITGASRVL